MRKGKNSHQVVHATDTHDGSSVCSTIVGHTGSSPSTLPCFPGLYRLSSLFACNTAKEQDERQCALIRCASFKHDLATELDVKFESCNFQRHLRRQGFVHFDDSFRTVSSQRFFNFILRTHANHLQEFSHAEVIGFFFHICSRVRIM